MNKFKNSFLLKVGALVVAPVMAWISITSSCYDCPTDDTPGQVCFSLAQTCSFPPGTQLCIIAYNCHNDPEGQEAMYALDTTCEVAVGGTSYSVVANATLGGLPFNNLPVSYYDLYKFHFGTYPTATQLASVTAMQAETWYENWVSFLGGTYTGITTTSTSYTASPICETKFITACYNAALGISDDERFGGYIKCPGGETVAINPVSLDDEIAGCECCNSNVTVSVSPPCPICN